jgi:beta-phosphoglucomutase family hydrolase
MKKYQAFLFDLNGTMVDDMQYHIKAWHNILTSLGANISAEKMKTECYGKNDELLERIFPGRYSADEKKLMGNDKEQQYRTDFKPNLKLINGLETFIKVAHNSGIKIAIGSAAITPNIDFVLDGLNLRPHVDVIVSADHVTNSKPDPETFIKCAEQLQIPAEGCLVFEDSPKGVEAALHAGMDCIVITTMHTEEEFSSFDNVVSFIKDYEDERLLQV